MVSRLAVLGVCALAACVGDGRRAVDAADGTDTIDVDEVATETIEPDAGEVGDGASDDDVDGGVSDAVDGETTATACVRASDCREPLPACQYWACPAGECEALLQDAGPCDDDDVCTGVGTCVLGVCEPGPALTCETPSACFRPTCDALEGCGAEAVGDGFCDAGGSAWGMCVGNRMVTLDRCDARGSCVDGPSDPSLPLPKDLALGDWFVLVQAVQSNGLATIAGDATFYGDASWEGRFETAEGEFEIDDQTGSWCLDPEGGVAFELGFDRYVGQVDNAGEHFAGHGGIGHEIALAVRPQGDLIDFDGVYFALASLPNEDGELQTWTGTFTATLGCVDDDALLVGDIDREPLSVASADVCLSYGFDGRVHAVLPVDAGDGVTTSLSLVGAIGPRGEVALFYRRVSEQLAFGSVVLVRLAGSSADHFRGSSRWVVAMQERTRAGLYRDAQGALTFLDDALVNGVVGGEAVLGRHVSFDDYGRFVMTLETANARRTLSGYLTGEGAIGIFYEVDAPSTWSSLFEVTEAPAWPSVGFIVRHP